jgi:HEPN domain-containing protein
MDRGARQLILGTLGGVARRDIVRVFLGDQYADFDDYTSAVREVWGDASADRMHEAVRQANATRVWTSIELAQQEDMAEEAKLLYMPEPDFRLAVLLTVHVYGLAADPSARITAICKRRGIPWEFTASEGFGWVGDTDVETLAMRPALSAIADLRLAGATRTEFEQARVQLAIGTPAALKLSVIEAGSAVESAMKVLLTERGVTYPSTDPASKLFGRLKDAGIVELPMERIILGASMVRNKKAGHGAGEVPHDVPQETAEAVLASAAVSIAYLHKLLP